MKSNNLQFFHYDARVTLLDGSTEKIGKIVNQKLKPELLSFDPSTKEFTKTFIKDHKKNDSNIDNWIAFEVVAGEGSGKRKFKCTHDQVLITSQGSKTANNLNIGNDLIVKYKDYVLNDQQLQLILGSALGDGSLRATKNGKASFRVGHGGDQEEYMFWKKKLLNPISNKIIQAGNGKGFDTIPLYYLGKLHNHLYNGSQRKITKEYLDMLSNASIAAWYMDDGSLNGSYAKWGNGNTVIHNKTLNLSNKKLVMDYFNTKWNVTPTLTSHGFFFSGERSKVFFEKVAPYIHPSMDYKIPPKFRQEFIWNNTSKQTLDEITKDTLSEMKITNKYEVSVHPKKRYLFNLEVDSNNFFIDNVLVPSHG